MTVPVLVTRYVYLLEREDGAFKVGSSNNPDVRLKAVEYDQGFDFTLVQEWEHPEALTVELDIHHRLRRRMKVALAEFGGRETYIIPKPTVLRVINEVVAMWVSAEQCLAAFDACGGDGKAAALQLGLTSYRPLNRALKKRWAVEDAERAKTCVRLSEHRESTRNWKPEEAARAAKEQL